MGMFDYLRVEMPLPGPPDPPIGEFQTKDLDCHLDSFVLKADGRLYEIVNNYEPDGTYFNDQLEIELTRYKVTATREVLRHHQGSIRFYTGDGTIWYEYVAVFAGGRCILIECVEFRLLPKVQP